MWNEPEADKFAEIAIQKKVPKEKIYIENKSTNTGDNFRFTKELIKKEGLDIKTCMVICRPYNKRRVQSTFNKLMPEYEGIFVSESISFEDYFKRASNDEWIHVLVGDIQRMKVYADYGWQEEVKVPDNVWKAYEELVELGYNKYIIK